MYDVEKVFREQNTKKIEEEKRKKEKLTSHRSGC